MTITPDYVFWNDVYSALIGDQVIGFYALVLDRAKLRLEHLWVAPHIGSGAGRLLLHHAVARAAKINAGPIEIISDPNAEGFYVKWAQYGSARRSPRSEGQTEFCRVFK